MDVLSQEKPPEPPPRLPDLISGQSSISPYKTDPFGGDIQSLAYLMLLFEIKAETNLVRVLNMYFR